MSDEMRKIWEECRKQIEKNIRGSGQAVQVVRPTIADPPESRPFMYTIGNHAHGLPELLVVGTGHEHIAKILNGLGYIQRRRAKAFDDEELVSVGGRFPLRIVDAGEIGRTKYATFVGIYYGTQDYEVRQVLLCDEKGRWPDTPGCDISFAEQPVLSKMNGRSH